MDRQKAKDTKQQNNFNHPFLPLEVEGIIEKEIRHDKSLCHRMCMSLYGINDYRVPIEFFIDLLGWSCVIYLIGLEEDS